MADVAIDWKFGYGDGELTTWTVAELEDFALGWCPRKLTIPPDMVEPLLEATGGHPPADVVGLLDRLWRVEHERIAEILEVLGRHHGDKTVAKHARKVLAEHRPLVATEFVVGGPV